MSQAETTEIREGHVFDTNALSAYLERALPGFRPPLTVRQFKGGQSNPTFLLETPGRRYVLRKKPAGQLLPGAHMIEREYRVMHALAGSPVPVATAYLLCEDTSVIGTAFYVMDFLEGRVFRDPSLPELARQERAPIYDAMVDIMARLHAVDWQAAGLEGFGKPAGYLTRQVGMWTKQYRAAEHTAIPAMEQLIAWLPEHIPADDRTTIAHGDYRLENLFFAPGQAQVLAVLDWELATLGHPYADLAYNCMIWHLPHDTPHLGGLGGRDLAALGIPTEEAYLARYCAKAGIERVPDYHFYLAFAFFRFAAIAQGIYARAKAGNASAPNALEVGLLAAPLAELGWKAAQNPR